MNPLKPQKLPPRLISLPTPKPCHILTTERTHFTLFSEETRIATAHTIIDWPKGAALPSVGQIQGCAVRNSDTEREAVDSFLEYLEEHYPWAIITLDIATGYDKLGDAP